MRQLLQNTAFITNCNSTDRDLRHEGVNSWRLLIVQLSETDRKEVNILKELKSKSQKFTTSKPQVKPFGTPVFTCHYN